MTDNTQCAARTEKVKEGSKRDEWAQALAEKWDKVIQLADPLGYEDQYPKGEEYVAMMKDFLLGADEPLALEVLGLQELIVLGGCEDIAASVELLDETRAFLGNDPLAEELFSPELPDAMWEEAGIQESGFYRYYSTKRPIDIGSYPNPDGNKPVSIENFGSRILADNGNTLAWGYLEYARPLPEWQYRGYELRPAFTASDQMVDRFVEEKKERSVLADLRARKSVPAKTYLPHKSRNLTRREAR